ncbi:caspase-14-like isoform X2 [Salvelinus namaycush]|uniref:Caspase-14-like isoform X2 n=1 Tax=Salvelinus namaycush TaxID=8040 RepID=A0A8U0QE77_SALNM|nr:caspase-14-like isoform X2 [Salvelinus namaycush]
MDNSQIQEIDRYDLKEQRRALMLCTKKGHKGADGDLKIMTKLFMDYGFLYKIKIDKTAKEMKKAVSEFRDDINRSPENTSCVFVVITSHGHRDVIIGADNNCLPVKDIIEPFGDELCSKMKGKPKVFIINACRGPEEDFGVPLYSAADTKPSKKAQSTRTYRSSRVPPCIDDMLVAYSSMTDYVSLMSSVGSHMIVDIGEVFDDSATEKEHVYDLLVKANAKMVMRDTTKKVVMTIESTLKRLLYLERKTGAETTNLEKKDECFLL